MGFTGYVVSILELKIIMVDYWKKPNAWDDWITDYWVKKKYTKGEVFNSMLWYSGENEYEIYKDAQLNVAGAHEACPFEIVKYSIKQSR